jgi:hypothetical protein
LRSKILLYGNDGLLLMTRRLILEKAGYQPIAVSNYAETKSLLMNERVEVFVLCQSLSNDERASVLEFARSVQPGIKVIVQRFTGDDMALSDGHFLGGIRGPKSLLAAVEKLLERS